MESDLVGCNRSLEQFTVGHVGHVQFECHFCVLDIVQLIPQQKLLYQKYRTELLSLTNIHRVRVGPDPSLVSNYLSLSFSLCSLLCLPFSQLIIYDSINLVTDYIPMIVDLDFSVMAFVFLCNLSGAFQVVHDHHQFLQEQLETYKGEPFAGHRVVISFRSVSCNVNQGHPTVLKELWPCADKVLRGVMQELHERMAFPIVMLLSWVPKKSVLSWRAITFTLCCIVSYRMCQTSPFMLNAFSVVVWLILSLQSTFKRYGRKQRRWWAVAAFYAPFPLGKGVKRGIFFARFFMETENLRSGLMPKTNQWGETHCRDKMPTRITWAFLPHRVKYACRRACVCALV